MLEFSKRMIFFEISDTHLVFYIETFSMIVFTTITVENVFL